MKTAEHMKTEHIKARDQLLARAREMRMRAGQARARARETYGANPEPNPFPVSGGICDHWPREVSDEIVGYVHAKQDAVAAALVQHKKAGLREVTFRRILRNIHQLSLIHI